MFMKYYENNLAKLMEKEFNFENFKFLFSDMIYTLCTLKL